MIKKSEHDRTENDETIASGVRSVYGSHADKML